MTYTYNNKGHLFRPHRRGTERRPHHQERAGSWRLRRQPEGHRQAAARHEGRGRHRPHGRRPAASPPAAPTRSPGIEGRTGGDAVKAFPAGLHPVRVGAQPPQAALSAKTEEWPSWRGRMRADFSVASPQTGGRRLAPSVCFRQLPRWGSPLTLKGASHGLLPLPSRYRDPAAEKRKLRRELLAQNPTRCTKSPSSAVRPPTKWPTSWGCFCCNTASRQSFTRASTPSTGRTPCSVRPAGRLPPGCHLHPHQLAQPDRFAHHRRQRSRH